MLFESNAMPTSQAGTSQVEAERSQADGSAAAAVAVEVSTSGRPEEAGLSTIGLVGRSRFVPLPRLVKSAG